MTWASRVYLGFMMQNEIREKAYVRLKIVLTAYGTSWGNSSLGTGEEVKSWRLGTCRIGASIRRGNFGTCFVSSLEQP